MERIVVYDEKHWELLKQKRRMGVVLLEFLARYGIEAFIFGSVARGDVHRYSDVEVVIPNNFHLNRLEVILHQKYTIYEKVVTMATPSTSIKVGYVVGDNICIVVPITPLTQLEWEFYDFGGRISLPHARNYRFRVPGVNKKFCLVIPMKEGHREVSVSGRESEVAKFLGVSIDIVLERKKYLSRRDEKGRSGLYLNEVLNPEEDVIGFIKKLVDRDPVIRRNLRERGVHL